MPLSDTITLINDGTINGFASQNGTEAERLAIATPNVGEQFYQTDGDTGLYIYDGAAWEYSKDYQPLTINTQSGTSYTLLISDAGKYVRMTNAAANTATVPPNSSVAFEIGTEVIVRQAGAGATTVVEGAGVTINTSGTLALAAQHDSVSLVKVATDEWDLVGSTA